VLPASSSAGSGDWRAPRLVRFPAEADALHVPLTTGDRARSRTVRASAAPPSDPDEEAVYAARRARYEETQAGYADRDREQGAGWIADWEARIASYGAVKPGVLSEESDEKPASAPVTAGALDGWEARIASYGAVKPGVLSTEPEETRASEPDTAGPVYGGLAHLGVLVADTERSLRFYRDVLGMEDETSLRNSKLPFPGAFVRAGAQQIHIMEYGNAGIPENPDHFGVPARGEDPLAQRPEHAGRDRHVALTIQDLAPLKQALADAGVAYTMSKSGRAALFCHDPDGNGLEFVETPESA
jgi:glyoxylase I family protein